MPTYSYLCSDCGHRFDTVQRMSEDSLTECPACKQAALVRQVSAVGFALKGSGWYVTDFRDKNKPKTSDGDGTAAATASTDTKAADTKTGAPESKPAASTDSGTKTAASSD